MKSKYYFDENFVYTEDTSMRYVKTLGMSLNKILAGPIGYNLEVVNAHIIRCLDLTLLKKET